MSCSLAIVVPCFNEEAVLRDTNGRLLQVLTRLCAVGLIAETSSIVYVDDGSRDGTWSLVERLAGEDERVHGIKLSRNVGHQRALLAGLLSVEADALISIDADLQDDTEAIEPMVRAHLAGAEVVFGVRRSRASDSLLKRSSARWFYRLMRWVGVELVADHADFRLLGRRAIAGLRGYREVNLFLRGIVPQIGFETAIVEYDRRARPAGVSKYGLRTMLAFALEGLTSFSIVPLRLITVLGLLVSLSSFGMILFVLYGTLILKAVIPGWASTVVPIYFLGGIQLLATGIIGEYLAKIYLETKARPRYLIDERV